MRGSAERVRRRIQHERHEPDAFRAALLSVAPTERDAWLNSVLALEDVPDDGPDLPRGCVPYFPCSVDAVLRMAERARVTAADVFVDIGSGLGRTAALVHLLTGAEAVGVEIQADLVRAARNLTKSLGLSRITYFEGDASTLFGALPRGSIFFLYCPFSGDRLASLLGHLEVVARCRPIRICCVDLPLPVRPWLTPEVQPDGDLTIYRTE